MGEGKDEIIGRGDAPGVAAPKGDFEIVLERSGDADVLGFTVVSLEDKFLKVSKVMAEGLIPAWNNKHTDRQLKRDDVILAVNGVRGEFSLMVEELKKNKSSTLLVLRSDSPETPRLKADFKITVDRNDDAETIGKLFASQRHKKLKITSVAEGGLIAKWNKKNENNLEILVNKGDSIVGVELEEKTAILWMKRSQNTPRTPKTGRLDPVAEAAAEPIAAVEDAAATAAAGNDPADDNEESEVTTHIVAPLTVLPVQVNAGENQEFSDVVAVATEELDAPTTVTNSTGCRFPVCRQSVCQSPC